MRDKLIHEYFGVDIDVLWETQQDVPHLKVLITRVMEEFENGIMSLVRYQFRGRFSCL